MILEKVIEILEYFSLVAVVFVCVNVFGFVFVFSLLYPIFSALVLSLFLKKARKFEQNNEKIFIITAYMAGVSGTLENLDLKELWKLLKMKKQVVQIEKQIDFLTAIQKEYPLTYKELTKNIPLVHTKYGVFPESRDGIFKLSNKTEGEWKKAENEKYEKIYNDIKNKYPLALRKYERIHNIRGFLSFEQKRDLATSKWPWKEEESREKDLYFSQKIEHIKEKYSKACIDYIEKNFNIQYDKELNNTMYIPNIIDVCWGKMTIEQKEELINRPEKRWQEEQKVAEEEYWSIYEEMYELEERNARFLELIKKYPLGYNRLEDEEGKKFIDSGNWNLKWDADLTEIEKELRDAQFEAEKKIENVRVAHREWNTETNDIEEGVLTSGIEDILKRATSQWDKFHGTIPYNYFVNYYPVSRYGLSIDVEHQHDRYLVWNFKDGIGNACDEIIRLTENLLKKTYGVTYVKNLTFVCVPASNKNTYKFRCERFSETICKDLGMKNGYNHVGIEIDGDPKHIRGGGKSAVYSVDVDFFKNKWIVIFDDILTSGQTVLFWTKYLESIGAKVLSAIFIGKTV